MGIIKTNYKLHSSLNKKIVLISDIHYNSKKDINYLNNILESIIKINPDYICIPGDLIDQANIFDKDYLINWLTNLSNISKVFYSLGNHEYYQNKKKKKYQLNNELLNEISNIKNLYLLNNENIVIDNINFIGVNFPIDYYFKEDNNEIEKYTNTLKIYKDKYNILLCHSPININKITNKFNLILCGHMHGGVIPHILRIIIKHRGLISPKGKLFPKYCYGHIKFKNDIIITSGITVISNLNPFRKFKKLFRGEVVVIEI